MISKSMNWQKIEKMLISEAFSKSLKSSHSKITIKFQMFFNYESSLLQAKSQKTALPSVESVVSFRVKWALFPFGVLSVLEWGTCSVRLYHWATGLRGFSSISYQWSLPRPENCGPIPQHPITSLLPILELERKKQKKTYILNGELCNMINVKTWFLAA